MEGDFTMGLRAASMLCRRGAALTARRETPTSKGAMNDDGQQSLLGFFTPAAGVHKVPPPAAAKTVRAQRVAEVRQTAVGAVVLERSARANNYRLTLRRDGTAVATIPARGSEREALRFVEQQRAWLERARARQAKRPRGAEIWTVGTHVLWRGEMAAVRIAAEGEKPQVCLAADVFRVRLIEGDLRPTLEAHFARRAKIELPARTWELAAVTGVEVKHVTVRNQRSRWGSCSANGTISLNWRLVQTPDFVRDYIIYHELMHLKEMNHSERFWARVAEVCPDWQDAERWIKRNGSLIGL
jgi:predicted metal-dependent hydrolase